MKGETQIWKLSLLC